MRFSSLILLNLTPKKPISSKTNIFANIISIKPIKLLKFILSPPANLYFLRCSKRGNPKADSRDKTPSCHRKQVFSASIIAVPLQKVNKNRLGLCPRRKRTRSYSFLERREALKKCASPLSKIPFKFFQERSIPIFSVVVNFIFPKRLGNM